jgi:hypothetical protein
MSGDNEEAGLAAAAGASVGGAAGQPWEVNEDLFDCMRAYYVSNTEDNVKYYEAGGGYLSDGEEEDE